MNKAYERETEMWNQVFKDGKVTLRYQQNVA